MSEGDQSEWSRLAQRDWFRVGVHVRVDDPAAAGFFLQQCLEKFLKGWLLARGWQLRKTHELDRLLDAATGFEPSLGSFRGLCERISGYYIVERYPGNYVEGPDADQIERDLDEARSLIETLFPTIDLRA